MFISPLSRKVDLLLFALLVVAPVTAQEPSAVSELRARAERGDREAQFDLSQEPSLQLGEAMRWLRLSADQGFVPAQMSVGNVFLNGTGAIATDDVEAFTWYKRAADQGSARGQNAVGDMYFEGRGVWQNERESVRWYRLAAEQGYALAQNNLGYAYQEARGVERDDRQAEIWYRKAVKQGSHEARLSLVLQYLRGRAKPEPGESVLELFEQMEQETDLKTLAAIVAAGSLGGRFGMLRDVKTALHVAHDAHLTNDAIVAWFADLYLRDSVEAPLLRSNLQRALEEGETAVVSFLERFDAAVPVRIVPGANASK